MRNGIKKIGFMLLVLCVMLVLAGLSTIDGYFSHHQVSCATECSCTSGQAEQSHADFPGDENFANGIKAKSNFLPDLIVVFQAPSDPLTNNYYAHIWQPPRNFQS